MRLGSLEKRVEFSELNSTMCVLVICKDMMWLGNLGGLLFSELFKFRNISKRIMYVHDDRNKNLE